MRYRRYGAADDAFGGPMRNISLAGEFLVGVTGSRETERVVAVNTATGDRTVAADADDFGQTNLLAATDVGWLQRRDGITHHNLVTGESRSYANPTLSDRGFHVYCYAPDADARGAVVFCTEYDWQNDTPTTDTNLLTYLDFATGTYRTLQRGASAEGQHGEVEVSGDTVAWARGSSVKWFDRAADGPTQVHSTGKYIYRLALNGSNVMFAHLGTAASRAVSSGPLGGPYTPLASTLRINLPMYAADKGDFVVSAGATVTDSGLYRVRPGSAALGKPVVLFGRGAPYGIAASAGRLVTVMPLKEPEAVVRGIDDEEGAVTVSGPSKLVPRLPDQDPPLLSGGHSVYLEDSTAVILDGDREVGRYAVPKNTWGVRLSGQRLVATIGCDFEPTTQDEDGVWHGTENCAAVDALGGAEIIDFDTGARTRVPFTQVLFGTEIGYGLPTGEIRRRDILTGSEKTVRPAGVAPGTKPVGRGSGQILIEGDWVLYSVNQDYARGDGGDERAPAEVVAVNTATGKRVELPADIEDTGNAEIRLADGVAAWVNRESREVHVVDLSSGKDTVVGRAHLGTWERPWLALTNEFVAWVAGDDKTHIRSLKDAADGPPRYLGTIDAATFSSAGADYRPQIDVSRPLTSWTLTVRAPASGKNAAATGTIVRTLKGSAKTGGVRPAWNGKTASGKRLPDGVYTWTLTGKGNGGTLTRKGGKAISGTVRLDSVTPTPKLTVPAQTGKAAPRNGFTVRWSSAERGVKYTVAVAVGTPGEDGKLDWSSRKTWQSKVKSTSAKYVGTKVPYVLKNNRSYRFTVTAVDATGNTDVTTKTVKVPKK